MEVLICAAGQSKRMGDLTKKIPKPLLPLGKKSILENLIESITINKKEVECITILIGYLGDRIKEKIGDEFNGVKINYIQNELYSQTNNMYSLYLAKDKINDDISFVSGDVFITKKLCNEFLFESEPNSILTDINTNLFDLEDPVKVSIKNSSITAIDKKLYLNQVNGVAVGMYKLSRQVSREFFQIAEDLIKKGNLNYGYIEPIKILIEKYRFTPFYTNGGIWGDIDTKEEYEKIKMLINNNKL